MVPFSNIHAVEMVDSLAKYFKMRFADFCGCATIIYTFDNPFYIEVSDVPEKSQLNFAK